MVRVAITGNIASGKSTVERFLLELGYPCLNTDDAAHELLEDNQEVLKAFSDHDILDANGKISREKLGKVVFSDKKLLAKLEGILHPMVRERILEFFAQNRTQKLLFVAIPQLYEAKMQDLFDNVVLVYTDDEIRFERLLKRNSYTEEYARTRIQAQMSQEEKRNIADFCLENNGSIDDLKVQINSLLAELEEIKP